MLNEDKAGPKPEIWACITVHPSLPSKAAQIGGARAWGAHLDWSSAKDVFRTYVDDLSAVGRTTRWEDKLPMRDALIAELAAQPGPQCHVFFRTPLCIGFSERHAAETLKRVFEHGALVYVQTELALYRGGDDLEDLLEAVGREARAAIQRRYRANKTT